jgi:acetylornithine/succinyldiaminopimelate/putrescine aminotransferase/predicted amino acid dehydrogenase
LKQRRIDWRGEHDGNQRASVLIPNFQRSDSVVRVDSHPNHDSVTRHKPGLNALLSAVGLDVVYHRGQGDLLYYHRDDGREIEVVDLVGGYGVLSLGHRHPEIVNAITDFLASGQANHVQGSIRPGALQLADALNVRTRGDYCTILANSGTEGVEAALKHALLETQGRTFIALQGAFHGKTLGSLHATSNPRFRQPFCRGPGYVVRVVPGDLRLLRETFERVEDLAGFIFEPIQGEAGVRPVPAEFLRLAAKLCADRKIPLIADECQTGLGRTGCFLASESYGISADYIILSKALGGGLAKISAVLIDRNRYRQDFDWIHSSTFADDELSCQVALKVLDLIDGETIAACRREGSYLLRQMQSLQKRYPDVIAEVRGRGLMVGVQLQRPRAQSGFMLNHLAERELLGPLVAGFLLNQHRIRVAPTLSDPSTLRMQPSLLVGRERLQQVVAAWRDVCVKLADHDVVGLTGHLARPPRQTEPLLREPFSATPIYHFARDRSTAATGSRRIRPAALRRIAWVFHLIDSSDIAHLDPAFAELTTEEKNAFCERWSSLCEPVVMETVDIRSLTDEVVRLYPILLPVTSQWMLNHSRGKRLTNSRRLVQKAVDVAAALHCNVVTLGQFTSIVTRRGESLDNHSMQITAGSNYSAALVSQAVRAELIQRDRDPADLTLGVVGAAGDVASTCAAMMAPEYRQCLLVGSGNAGSIQRLNKLASEIPGARVAANLQAIQEADVVVCATNSTTAPLGPECLHSDAIVCDASVPATLQPSICDDLPEVTVFPGAIAVLPGKESLEIPGFPLPRGFTYGCMAEGLLLGLDGDERNRWSGRSSSRRAAEISQVAARHGFTAAGRSSMRTCAENATS